jgi:hypothetical protein
MDGHRFDGWTRGLANGLSRRAVMRALAGVALAATMPHPARANESGAVACDEDEPNPDSVCPNGYRCNFDLCVPCLKHGQTLCAFHSDCCGEAGLICNDHGRCTYGQGGGKVKCDGKGCKKGKGKG